MLICCGCEGRVPCPQPPWLVFMARVSVALHWSPGPLVSFSHQEKWGSREGRGVTSWPGLHLVNGPPIGLELGVLKRPETRSPLNLES